MTLKSLLFLTFLATTSHGLIHDDLIVAVGDQLEFLSNGTTYRKLTLDSYNASKLSALAYDASTRKLFFSDRRHSRGHIFSVNLDTGSDQAVQDVIEKSSNETVESLAYDPVDQMLLWTDGLNRSIRRVKIDHDHVHVRENATVELVHFLEKDDKPRGLVSDHCNRMLYWTNRYMPRPTIERSHLNGSHREIVVQTNLLLPHALDLDVMEQRLYWADNLRNGYFHIERSFVNGTGRQLIHRGIGQFVVSLTVGRDYVYWSDYDHKKVWALAKDGSSEKPDVLRHYLTSPPMGLLVFHHQPIDCSRVPAVQNYTNDDDNLVKPSNQDPPYDHLDLCLGFCYNQGQCLIVDSDLRCSCSPGFSGDRCELVVEQTAQWACLALVGEISRAEIVALIGLSIACVVLMTLVIALTLRLRKMAGNKNFKRFKRRCLPTPVPAPGSVQDLENCCNSITMCERPCPQQANKTTLTKANNWIEDGDSVDLLKHEF